MADSTSDRGSRSDDLADSGFARVREGDYERALEIASELEERKHTAAFDIAAQAHAGLGDLETAVETLRRGVAAAPDCWLNWQLLGNYLSDLGRYSEAAEAYERALACSDPWEESVRLNQGILAGRRGDHDRALELLDPAGYADLSLLAADARIRSLRETGRLSEALSLADECLDWEWPAEDAEEALARIAAKGGWIRLDKGVAPAEVRGSALRAVARFGCADPLLALVREIDGRYSPRATYFRLLVEGLSRRGSGYFVTYHVVAESPEQALELVRELEDLDAAPEELRVEESEPLEARPDEPMGVYWRGDRSWYEEDT